MSLNKKLIAGGEAGGPYAAIFEFTGGGSNDVTVSGMSFQPDFIKFRKYGESSLEYYCHALAPNTFWRTTQVGTYSGRISNGNNQVIQFNSDGFTIKGNASTQDDINKSGKTFIGIALFAGNTSVSNTDGNVTSTVMASPDAGFSIVKFTSTGSSTTFGHGLGENPDIVVNDQPTEFFGRSTWYTDSTHYNEFRRGDGFMFVSNTTNSASQLISFPDSDTIQVGSSSEAGGGNNKEYYFFCFVQKPHQQFAMWNGNNSTSTREVYGMTDDAEPKYVRTNLVDNASSSQDIYQPLYNSVSSNVYRFDQTLALETGGALDEINYSPWSEYIRLDWANKRILTNSDSFYINGNYSSSNYHYIAYIYGGNGCEIL